MRGPLGADGVNDFERQPGAVFEAAAVVVGALVGERREKLVEQVAVGGVDLDEVEAGLRARRAAWRKASTMAAMPAWSSAAGTA